MKEYSFLNTILLINGVEITGFSDGDDVILCERLNDSVTHKMGADGEMSPSLSADRSGRFLFRLMQTSDSNTYLSGLLNLQENGAFVPIFVQFKDVKGNDLVSGTQGYIPRPASMSRGTNVNSQEWSIVVERMDMLHLGS